MPSTTPPTSVTPPSAALLAVPLATLAGFLTLALLTLVSVRLLGIGIRAGTFPVRSRVGWQVWATERLLDSARSLLFPLYASLLTPVWLRALGATVGKDVEASTVLLLPKMTTVGDGAFLADDTMVASYELNGGWLRIRPAKVGKRAFLGNSGMAAGGRSVPTDAPGRGAVRRAQEVEGRHRPGSGSPPVKLRRHAVAVDERRTFRPPTHLRWARAAVELCRFVPLATHGGHRASASSPALQALVLELGHAWALALSGVVLVVAGAVAAARHLARQVGGRRAHRGSEHPLWSSFVWRNEVVDTFVEMVAAPVVRQRDRRHADPLGVAAEPRRQDRPRGVVRDLLAARGRPRPPRERGEREPWAACCRPICSMIG